MKKRGTLEQNPNFKDADKEPDLPLHLIFFWDSFWELSTTRHELSAIPWTAMNDYAKRWGITTEEEFDSFTVMIRGLDSEFLNIKQAEIKKKQDMIKTKGLKHG